LAFARRPCQRHERVEGVVADLAQGTEVEIARAIVLERRQRGVLAKHVSRAGVAEALRESHPPRDLADDPPVGFHLAWQAQERALARYAPFGVGDSAILLGPGGGGKQHMRAG